MITALLSVSCSVSRKAVSEHSELKIESSETVERVLARASEQVDFVFLLLARHTESELSSALASCVGSSG